MVAPDAVRRDGLDVLHVVESYGAGTATAVRQYVESTPDVRHSLVRRLRNDRDHADDGELALFHEVREMRPGLLPAVRDVRRAVRELAPDVVHAHSSKAGVFVRVTPRTGARVVYTPHCFASERQDLGRVARAAVLLVERALARRTDAFAACSPRELEIARRIGPRAEHVLVPNIAPDDLPVVDGPEIDGPRRDVVTLGRIAAQRDPDFLVGLASVLGRDVAVTWVGDGDQDAAERLRLAGAEVTGWLPRSRALEVLARARVYVHTALWDAAPMSVVEAHALGVPVVVRRTAATAGMPDAWVVGTVEEMAARVRRLLASDSTAAENRVAWDAFFAGHTRQEQGKQLHAAWTGVVAP